MSRRGLTTKLTLFSLLSLLTVGGASCITETASSAGKTRSELPPDTLSRLAENAPPLAQARLPDSLNGSVTDCPDPMRPSERRTTNPTPTVDNLVQNLRPIVDPHHQGGEVGARLLPKEQQLDPAIQIMLHSGRDGRFISDGSGCIVRSAKGDLYILTVAHIIHQGQNAIEYYNLGQDGQMAGRQHIGMEGVDPGLLTGKSNFSTDHPILIKIAKNEVDETRALGVRPDGSAISQGETFSAGAYPAGGPVKIVGVSQGDQNWEVERRGKGRFVSVHGTYGLSPLPGGYSTTDFPAGESIIEGSSGACIQQDGIVVGVLSGAAGKVETAGIADPIHKYWDVLPISKFNLPELYNL